MAADTSLDAMAGSLVRGGRQEVSALATSAVGVQRRWICNANADEGHCNGCNGADTHYIFLDQHIATYRWRGMKKSMFS